MQQAYESRLHSKCAGADPSKRIAVVSHTYTVFCTLHVIESTRQMTKSLDTYEQGVPEL